MSNSEVTGPINLGNPREFSMLELAELIIKSTNSKSEIVFRDLPLDDPRQRKPNIQKAHELLNWSPTISLQEGLDLSIPDFKRRLQSL